MRSWSFYHAATGLFSGRRYSGPADQLLANTPQGFVAIDGVFDRHTQRFDIASGAVVDDDTLAAGRDQQHRRATALASIAALELRQARPQRELLLDPGSREAYVRLREIEAKIAELRASLVDVNHG